MISAIIFRYNLKPFENIRNLLTTLQNNENYIQSSENQLIRKQTYGGGYPLIAGSGDGKRANSD